MNTKISYTIPPETEKYTRIAVGDIIFMLCIIVFWGTILFIAVMYGKLLYVLGFILGAAIVAIFGN